MATKKKESFEAQLQRLEGIVETMESGSDTLENSLKAYEDGMRLIRSLEGELAAAAQRLTMLRTGENGEDEEVPAEGIL